MNWIIIVAGGNGERMNLGYNKIFAKLNKKPIIYWTLKVFEDSPVIDKIVISSKETDAKKIAQIVKKYGFAKVVGFVTADKTRQDSTFKVLEYLKDKAAEHDLIGVHNGVNPFVTPSELKEVFSAAKQYGASLLAHPARDRVKITDDNTIIQHTPIRTSCWYAQTPQVATFGNLYKAFIKAQEDNFVGTDDTQLLERIDLKAKIVHCSNMNFKITFKEDLILARRIVKNFHEK